MKSAQHFGGEAFVKDIRELGPAAYGLKVYPQAMESLQRQKPTLHRISSDGLRYRRLGVPVRAYWVCHSFEIDVSPSFLLS